MVETGECAEGQADRALDQEQVQCDDHKAQKIQAREDV